MSNIEYEKIQQTLPELRIKESKIASDLQRNTINLDNQEKEIERAKSRSEEIQIQIDQIINDIKREQFLLDDAVDNLSRVSDEKSLLEKQQGDLFLEEYEKLDMSKSSSKNNNPIIDYLDFEDGYEKAIAAVFSEELMAFSSINWILGNIDSSLVRTKF